MSNVISELPKNPVGDSRQKSATMPESWSRFTGVVVTILVYVLSLFGGALLLNAVAQTQGWSAGQIDVWLQNSVESQFFYILFDGTIAVLLLAGFIRMRRYKNVLKTLGLLWPKIRDIGYALLGIASYFLLYIAVVSVASSLTSLNIEQEQDVGFDTIVSQRDLILTFVSLVILPPLVEELIFRGFLFGGLRKKMRFASATFITSVLFAIPHLLGGLEGEGLLWIAGVDTFVLSLILCSLREKTGSIWAGIGVHALKNGIAFWLLYIHR